MNMFEYILKGKKKSTRDIFGELPRIKVCYYCNSEIDDNESYEYNGQNKFTCYKCSKFSEPKLANINEEQRAILSKIIK